ncbi:hypothetical protein BIV60_18980 [Bacillus sp. MUM 116]|uniref:hypothetical protein n=1 Tax=Bacillus sp. MUM 116 TaxID=1678002 RepID=UPI0008F5A3A5|nr:hypothetical protein [Bacillus sp. MUM 116]OIK11035.1 hypothetical protein BIV60_18980 [Bacillus sp. MUM 116]
MLAKVNELNRNVVILLSVLIIAITSVIVTLIATRQGSGNGSSKSLSEFQEFVVKEYGVRPDIQITFRQVPPVQARNITESLAKKLNLEGAGLKEYDGIEWYGTRSEKGDIAVDAFYK